MSASEPATPTVTVRVPGLLARFADGTREVTVRADSVGGALDGLFEAHPALETHVLDGRGELREHVILFVDGERIDWTDREDVELTDEATVTVMQAVSGGGRCVS